MSHDSSMHSPRVSQVGALRARRWYRRVADRMRPATTPLLAVSQTPPGALHAATGAAAQSLAYTPVHLISPATDFVHRCIALFAAVFAVCAVYGFLNPVAAGFALDYTLQTAREAGSRSVAAVTLLAEYTGSRAPALQAVDRQHAAAALTTRADMTPARNVSLAAAAATATTSASMSKAVPSSGAIAVSVPFSGQSVAYGDIVSYDSSSTAYSLSTAKDKADVYGVVVETPPLLFHPAGREGDISVVHTGPALVNVTMENGKIAVGDPISVSSIPGKGRHAAASDYVIGLAVEPFDGTDGVVLQDARGKDILSSTILVNVSAGAGVGQDGGAGTAATGVCQSFLCKFFAAVEGDSVDLVVRYSLAAAVAAVSIWFAFKSFVSEANYGVISVGRNPRAKASIQSMVVFNAVLALVVAGAGIFASVLIIIAAP